MRWISLLLFCCVLLTTLADPDPKKYKNESVEKDKKTEALTDVEKNFLREVEEKFGVKSEVPVDIKKDEGKVKVEKIIKEDSSTQHKPSFPAVIAIEIVNDTDSKLKGKRTIDANLGYGYRTNNGYTYTYFGKSNQDKGKFMIYPYSQEDIPPRQYNNQGYEYRSPAKENYSSHASSVEIQPSQAYELVPFKNEQPSYHYNKPSIEFKTNYEKNLNTPTTYTSGQAAQTLYTTYNGQELSGLSGQFPSVMPNYFVDASQLLKNPQYQNAGLTQDHLRTQNSYLNQNQRIVPVLVLRVPSSYLKNPTAELYPDLPKNYPLSQHLNSVNLQELVNQYFKKNGYSFAPQVMSYQNPTVPPSVTEPQQYSNPYVKPTYTQADYSGIQYSAVKPVMARYPLTYTQQKYLLPQPQSLYQRPADQQYEYKYQYVPQTEVKMRTYYIQPQYQQISEEAGAVPNAYQNEQSVADHQSNGENTSSNVEYTPQYTSSQQAQEAVVDYESQNSQPENAQPDVSSYVSTNSETGNYDANKENVDYAKQTQYESASPVYNSKSSEYYSNKPDQTNTVSVLPSKLIHTEQYQESAAPNSAQEYTYQSRENGDSSQSFALSENYPSRDHTIATVLPYSYKSPRRPPSIPSSSFQTVSYVTPMPSAKYQSQYKIMVPQTVLKHPNSEKVSYVNSHSVPMHYSQTNHYTEGNSDNDYASSQYSAPIATKPSYPRTYHTHPKRMVRPDSKPEGSPIKVLARKQNERREMKKSS